MHTKRWSEHLRARDYAEDPCVDGRIMAQRVLGKVWIGFVWLSIGTDGGLLGTRQRALGFHNRKVVSLKFSSYQLLKKDCAPCR